MAPEVFDQSGHYDKAADVYSFGIILWEIATREKPFSDAPPDVKGSLRMIEFIRRGGRSALPDNMPTWFCQLIAQCWAQDPSTRPSFDHVVAALEENVVVAHEEAAEKLRTPSGRLLPLSIRRLLSGTGAFGQHVPLMSDVQRVTS